jgi:hypothetical protein
MKAFTVCTKHNHSCDTTTWNIPVPLFSLAAGFEARPAPTTKARSYASLRPVNRECCVEVKADI